jgi:hypothetical protein
MVKVMRADRHRPWRARHPLPHPGDQEEEPEDDEHERQRPHQVDIARRKQRKRREARQPHHGNQGAEHDAARRGQQGELHRENHAVEEQIRQRAPDHIEVEAGEHGRS